MRIRHSTKVELKDLVEKLIFDEQLCQENGLLLLNYLGLEVTLLK